MPNFTDKPNQLKYSVGKGKRSNIIDTRGVPEAGRYKHKASLIKGPHAQIRIPRDHRKFEVEHPAPLKQGPAHYRPSDKSSKYNTPTFTFGYRFFEDHKSQTPAPCTYPREDLEEFKLRQTESNWKKKVNEKEGFNTSQERMKYRNLKSPGPGNYEDKEDIAKIGPFYRFGKDEKLKQSTFDNQNFPGPGTFFPKSVGSKSQGYSLALKLGTGLKQYETDAPGPGQYQPKLLNSNANIKVPIDKKWDIVNKEDLFKTGHCAYNQEIIHQQKFFIKADTNFGNSVRPPAHNTDDYPEPGHYSPPSRAIEGREQTMHGKLKDNKKQQAFFPGPGSYDPNSEVVMSSAMIVGTKTGQRTNFVSSKNIVTGPGSYDLNSNVVEKQANRYSIGNGQRFSHTKNTYEPGPGSYDVGGTIGKIPNYLLLSKRKNQGLLDFQ